MIWKPKWREFSKNALYENKIYKFFVTDSFLMQLALAGLGCERDMQWRSKVHWHWQLWWKFGKRGFKIKSMHHLPYGGSDWRIRMATSQRPLSTPFSAYQISNFICYHRLEIVGLFPRDPTPTLQAYPVWFCLWLNWLSSTCNLKENNTKTINIRFFRSLASGETLWS